MRLSVDTIGNLRWFALFLILLCHIAHTAEPREKPKILGGPVLLVDPSTGYGKALINLRNNSSNPLSVLLSASALQQASIAKSSDATVTFTSEDEKLRPEFTYRMSIPSESIVRVVMIVSNLWDAGQFETSISDQDIVIGKTRCKDIDGDYAMYEVSSP